MHIIAWLNVIEFKNKDNKQTKRGIENNTWIREKNSFRQGTLKKLIIILFATKK